MIDMSRFLKTAGILLFVAGGVLVLFGPGWAWMTTPKPGVLRSSLEENELFADGRKWAFQARLPKVLPSEFSVGIEIRRVDDPTSRHSLNWPTENEADQVIGTGRITVGDQPNQEYLIAVQRLDLNDFDLDQELEHSFRIVGGIQSGGAATSLLPRPAFYRGQFKSVSVHSHVEWQNDEACPLVFETTDGEKTYRYFVVVKVVS